MAIACATRAASSGSLAAASGAMLMPRSSPCGATFNNGWGTSVRLGSGRRSFVPPRPPCRYRVPGYLSPPFGAYLLHPALSSDAPTLRAHPGEIGSYVFGQFRLSHDLSNILQPHEKNKRFPLTFCRG